MVPCIPAIIFHPLPNTSIKDSPEVGFKYAQAAIEMGLNRMSAFGWYDTKKHTQKSHKHSNFVSFTQSNSNNTEVEEINRENKTKTAIKIGF